jgi:hypothetical protein
LRKFQIFNDTFHRADDRIKKRERSGRNPRGRAKKGILEIQFKLGPETAYPVD